LPERRGVLRRVARCACAQRPAGAKPPVTIYMIADNGDRLRDLRISLELQCAHRTTPQLADK